MDSMRATQPLLEPQGESGGGRINRTSKSVRKRGTTSSCRGRPRINDCMVTVIHGPAWAPLATSRRGVRRLESLSESAVDGAAISSAAALLVVFELSCTTPVRATGVQDLGPRRRHAARASVVL